MSNSKNLVLNTIKEINLPFKNFSYVSQLKEVWPSEDVAKNQKMLNGNRIDMKELVEKLQEKGVNASLVTHFSGLITCVAINE